MLLRRKIDERFLAWKKDRQGQCLLVKGARQVGKTTSILEFGKKRYKHCVYINFEEKPEYRQIFDGNLDIQTLTLKMTARELNDKLVPHETLLFLDEIQSCPQARTALKFFALDGSYDVIASGSLLGINYKDVSSYPVGFEKELEMYPMDFEEFLWALGIESPVLAYARTCFDEKKPLDDDLHERLMYLFREYMIVGGMPKIVSSYTRSKNIQQIVEMQQGLMKNYLADIGKYTSGTERGRVRSVFLSIPQQLSRKNKKFKFSEVEEGSQARTYADSLMWLHDADIARFCLLVTDPVLPLPMHVRPNSFKFYLNDTGLLVSMLDPGIQNEILSGRLDVNEGAITENVVANSLVYNGHELFYFERKGRMEIDFVLFLRKDLVVVEVKSGKNTASPSLDSLLEQGKYPVGRAIKLWPKNVEMQGRVECYPLYMACFL